MFIFTLINDRITKYAEDEAGNVEMKEKEPSIQERERKQLEENQNFCNLFEKTVPAINPRKRPRDVMENDAENSNTHFTQNMRKRHKANHDNNHNRNISSQSQMSQSPVPPQIPEYDPDDPFSLHFPANFTFNVKHINLYPLRNGLSVSH